MINFSLLKTLVEDQPALHEWLKGFEPLCMERITNSRHGDLKKWQKAVSELPDITPDSVELDSSVVSLGSKDLLSPETIDQMIESLKQLCPWRKGSFSLFGIQIDSEWRSDMKWQRVRRQMSPLEGRLVLDVGCGNGYYGWRILGDGARVVIGVDPYLIFNLQYQVFSKYLPDYPNFVLPLGVDEVPANLQAFDTVLSMGVFYHRRSPIDHLIQLKSFLRPGGELVLETLVIEGGKDDVLVPAGRYAKMNNVWFIPSVKALCGWLERVGFIGVNPVDVTRTTSEEQRPTQWMTFESLADYLDPNDPEKTVEGYPSPLRAIIIAKKPAQY